MSFCSAPRVPDFYARKPVPPTTPFCVNTFTNTHTCDDWEIDNYNAEVEAYNNDLNRYKRDVNLYIEELNQYLREAGEFAECEISNL